jgi:hypothetical protein
MRDIYIPPSSFRYRPYDLLLFQQLPLTQSASPVAVDAMPWNINDASDALRVDTDSWKTQLGILENQVLAVLGGLARGCTLLSVRMQICSLRDESGPTDAPGCRVKMRDWKSMIDNPVSGQTIGA